MRIVSTVPRRRWLAALALSLGCVAPGLSQQATASQDPGNDEQPGPEVLNRGPIHEAFANPITFDPTPGPVVPKQPADPIEEQPPDQKPEGENVLWIAGYWAWDDERTDFIWISGIWREPPPNCQWTPGYWDQCDGGWRWTCGCWTPVDQGAGQYLPPPPPSVEQGPSSPPPSENSNCSWTPGYWSWQETTETVAARYAWRPGCWMTYNPDWLWAPPRYVSTTCGYLFVPGYWDYPVERRGILYAPIYCAQTPQPNFVYCPSVCVSTTAITSCLFVQPRSQSYCFGDYFEARYSSSGIYPFYAFHNSRYGFDPIYSHCAATHFGDANWSRRLHEEYRYRRDNPSARPPRIYSESAVAQHRAATTGRFSNLALTMTPHQLSSHQRMPFRMTQVSASQRATYAQSGKQLHRVATNRRTEEINAARDPQRNPSQSLHVKTPWSPIASRSNPGASGPTHAGAPNPPHAGAPSPTHAGARIRPMRAPRVRPMRAPRVRPMRAGTLMPRPPRRSLHPTRTILRWITTSSYRRHMTRRAGPCRTTTCRHRSIAIQASSPDILLRHKGTERRN